MMKLRISFLAVLLLLPLMAQAATAPQNLGNFGLWHTFSLAQEGGAVCYMTLTGHPAQPQIPNTGKKSKAKPKLAKRGEVVLMITHRPAEGSKDVVSYAAGMKFKSASEAKIKIGQKDFSLFTQGDTAWSRDAATDHALALAIFGGQTINFTGVGAHGENLSDTLYLKGAAQAYNAINKACGLPVVVETSAKKPASHAKTPLKMKK